MTNIYLTISLSTHNGDDTPQNYDTVHFHRRMSKISDKPPASFSGHKTELRNVKSGGALRKIQTGITVLFF